MVSLPCAKIPTRLDVEKWGVIEIAIGIGIGARSEFPVLIAFAFDFDFDPDFEFTALHAVLLIGV